MAKEYFTRKGIPFTEKDISVDQEAYEFVVDKVGQAVTPIITINDSIVVGYDPPRIEAALNNTRQEKEMPKAA